METWRSGEIELVGSSRLNDTIAGVIGTSQTTAFIPRSRGFDVWGRSLPQKTSTHCGAGVPPAKRPRTTKRCHTSR